MTGCECPIAGFCHRHNIQKNEHWHRLCQTKPSYFQAWEQGRGPGQPIEQQPADTLPADDRRTRLAARKASVAERKARSQRMIGWVMFFRHPGERGLGDTLQRLKSMAPKQLKIELAKMQKECACRTLDAVKMWNERHPY
jgi:hypothetical protein